MFARCTQGVHADRIATGAPCRPQSTRAIRTMGPVSRLPAPRPNRLPRSRASRPSTTPAPDRAAIAAVNPPRGTRTQAAGRDPRASRARYRAGCRRCRQFRGCASRGLRDTSRPRSSRCRSPRADAGDRHSASWARSESHRPHTSPTPLQSGRPDDIGVGVAVVKRRAACLGAGTPAPPQFGLQRFERLGEGGDLRHRPGTFARGGEIPIRGERGRIYPARCRPWRTRGSGRCLPRHLQAASPVRRAR